MSPLPIKPFNSNSVKGNRATERLKEIKEKMPEFMREHGFPIKALACTGDTAPQELSDIGFINTAGYSWEPSTDKLKIMTPKLFLGDKKKGRFTKDTRLFEFEATLENITKFYEGEVITHATILSQTAALYDPIGFVAPLKVYGSYICRRALIESAGDPLKEVCSETRRLFIQYTYQVKMLETLTFSRNKHMLGRSPDDILILCTDAGYHAKMMILYIDKKEGDNLKLEFVFSIGNLNNESGNIPRNELDIMERGTKKCEKILEWMSPQVKNKILIVDAKVPLSWLKNKDLRTQPYVQTRIHNICRTFEADEAYYIRSKDNPSDLVLNLITSKTPTTC